MTLFWKVKVTPDFEEVGACFSSTLGCCPLYVIVIDFDCGEFIVFKEQIIILVLTFIGH